MPDKKQYWKAFEANRMTHQRYGERRIARGLRDQIDTVLDVMNEAGVSALLGGLDQFIKTEPLEIAYKDLYGRVGRDFADRAFSELSGKSHKDIDDWEDYMRNFASTEAGTRISQVSNVTLQRIRRVLEDGVDRGLGIEEIAKNMEQSNAVNRVRARVIARTEIVSASNAGSDLGARSTGLNMNKEWIATPDARTRDDHTAADGQVVEMDESFIVGGEEAKHPGDPKLSAHNVIQCRCVTGYMPQ